MSGGGLEASAEGRVGSLRMTHSLRYTRELGVVERLDWVGWVASGGHTGLSRLGRVGSLRMTHSLRYTREL